MSAQLQPGERRVRTMQVADVDAVHAVETRAYAFPWTRGNFVDSLAAGYHAWVLETDDGALLAYSVAMSGVGEMHLLNVTVSPEHQGRGHARRLLDVLEDECRHLHLATLWLEVRESNQRARTLYRQRGFTEVGLRRGYYPAPAGRREDAIVMRLAIDGDDDALD